MKLAQAKTLAETARAMLAPYCEVCEIAGSIRREKREVKDIELVCIPKLIKVPSGLFGETTIQRHPEFYTVLANLGPIVKGHPVTGKHIQVLLQPNSVILSAAQGRTIEAEPQGIVVDVFVATPENFGYIFMLRTGSAEWNKQVMLRRGKSLGLKFMDGLIWYRGQPQYTPDEATVFRLLNIPAVPPYQRMV